MSVVLVPTEIAKGVQMLSLRTPTLPPATHTNAYLFGTDELLLIEPASADSAEIERICAWVETKLDAGARLVGIFLTHHHHDHMAGAARVSARLRAPLWAHVETARRLPKGLAVSRELNDGEVLALSEHHRLEVLHTPGHAPGHLCLLDHATRVLVAGDMVAGVGSILIEPGDGDMVAYLASLTRMDAQNAALLLPAHGLPIADARAKLHGYVAHRLAREAKVLAALRQTEGPASLEQLLPVAYADTPQMAWPLAKLALEAHLIKLEQEARVARQGRSFRAL
ncbi:MAG: hypothetical protein RL385_1873 [Pseudomonadota bacterium]